MQVVMEIRVEAYALKAEYAAKYGKPFKAFATRKEGTEQVTETFFADTQAEAFNLGFNFVRHYANGRALTVAHFRSDKFKKIYSVWSK